MMHPVFYYLFALFYLSAILIVCKQAQPLNMITSADKPKSWLYSRDNIADHFDFKQGAYAAKIYFVLQSIILAVIWEVWEVWEVPVVLNNRQVCKIIAQNT